MDFLGIGGWELLLVLMIILLVWSPGTLVKTVRSLGRMVYSLKRLAGELTAEISKETDDTERDDRRKL